LGDAKVGGGPSPLGSEPFLPRGERFLSQIAFGKIVLRAGGVGRPIIVGLLVFAIGLVLISVGPWLMYQGGVRTEGQQAPCGGGTNGGSSAGTNCPADDYVFLSPESTAGFFVFIGGWVLMPAGLFAGGIVAGIRMRKTRRSLDH
jgi:hypothetical protein